MIVKEEDHLAHYGIIRRSGRYPWGSTNNVPQHNASLIDHIKKLLGLGMSETDIAKGLGMTTTELRAEKTIALNQIKQDQIRTAQALSDRGWGNSAIAERMFGSKSKESTVRALLAPGAKDKADKLTSTAEMLKRQVKEKGMIDYGAGVENQIGVTPGHLKTAVQMLKMEGYTIHYVKIPQLGSPGNFTTQKVVAAPGVTYSEVYNNRDKIRQIVERSDDGGRTFLGLRPPMPLSSDRVAVRYADQGGAQEDGLIYVRRGVKDVSLGNAQYAQVRINVDGTHYLKGMAVYNDDLPKGIDVLFNTNKNSTGNKKDAMKPMEVDPQTGKIDKANPFGAQIKLGGQILEPGPDGESRVTSVMNLVNEQGDWGQWESSRTLSTQMLSKQSSTLAQNQLAMTYERRQNEFAEIMALTNPTVRKTLLEAYADSVDAASVHLKAAALPRQATKVLLPVRSVKETEVYAPGFRDGETLALIRYPHGGKFEIPILTVNNRNREARRIIPIDAPDAIGINSKVAERLSGADFDGDTVVAIPNNRGLIKSDPALEGLKGFDPRAEYAAYPGMKKIKEKRMQQEMGSVSNLITDMTLRGAGSDELARAVRHSMVVIDSFKHNLDFKASARRNGIAALKEKYQSEPTGGESSGASTLISRASAGKRVDEFRPRKASEGGPVDRETGKKLFVKTDRTFVDQKGRTVKKQMEVERLSITDDAHTLSTGLRIERIYADHSNRLKSLANQARKEAVNTKPTPYSKAAKAAYQKEVASLNAKLNTALKNAPLERQAQLIANVTVSQMRQANPNMDASRVKKIKTQALTEARRRTGASKQRIEINWDEWNAIQAGAITNHKLEQILRNSDTDQIRKLATPPKPTVMTATKQARAKAMLANGFTASEIADQLGVALSTLTSSLNAK